MASIIVRNIDEELKRRLRIRAAWNGNSMEQEARDILKAALQPDHSTGADLVKAIRAAVEPLGGVELELPPRGPMRESPTFD